MRHVQTEIWKVETELNSAQAELFRFRYVKKFIDNYCPEGRFETLLAVMIIVVIGVVIRGSFEFWQESLVGGVVNRSLFTLRNRFFRRTIHLDVGNFSEAGTHELMTRFTNDIDTLGGGMKTLFGKVVAEPLKAVACIDVGGVDQLAVDADVPGPGAVRAVGPDALWPHDEAGDAAHA